MKPTDLPATVEQAERMGLDVLFWRYEQLELAGYPRDEAVSLAERPDVDLHLAVGLLARGASVEEALRILL